jgi:hypothetical protein
MYKGMQTKVNILLFQYAVKDDGAHARGGENKINFQLLIMQILYLLFVNCKYWLLLSTDIVIIFFMLQ